eukprot:6748738-Pyramimonas_sp.AAC.2
MAAFAVEYTLRAAEYTLWLRGTTLGHFRRDGAGDGIQGAGAPHGGPPHPDGDGQPRHKQPRQGIQPQ